MERECEVIHEEVLTHSNVVHRINGWRGEARVIVTVKIGAETYECNQIVSLRLKKPEPED